MKILVLGAGDMGSGVAEVLCDQGVGEVRIGDINAVNAEALVKLLSRRGCEARAFRVDALSLDSLREAVVGVDVVISTVGPFYRFGFRVASNLVKLGLNFVDICDDYDATEKELGLDEEASKRNIRAIVGLGWTPGLSNLLASMGARGLGGASAVDIYWVGSAADSKGLAVVMHLFYAIAGKVPMFIDGERVLIEAGSGGVEVELPEPFGRIRLFYTGHPEPLTIPRYLSAVKRVTVRGALVPQWQNSLARLLIRLTGGSPRNMERLAKLIHRVEGIFRIGGLRMSAVRVDIKGATEARAYVAMGRMRRLTGVPAALGGLMIARGSMRFIGVKPPEAAVDNPEQFLREVMKWDINLLVKMGGEWTAL